MYTLYGWKFQIDCEDFEKWFVFWEAADTGVSKASKSANPDSKDRNRFAVIVLRPSFSVPSSDDIYIASQSDRKNPIHNPAHLC